VEEFSNFIWSLLHPSSKPQLRVSLGLLIVELLGHRSHCSDNSSGDSSTARTPVQLLGCLFNSSAHSQTDWTPIPDDQQQVGQLGQAQDGVAQRIQGARGLAMGDMSPGIHKTRHGLHHQRWPSPQDQGMHGTGRRAP